MNPQRKKEILELIKTKLINIKKSSIRDCLTLILLNNRIDREEYYIIRDLLEKNKPTPDNEYQHFTKNPYWQHPHPIQQNIAYWWYPLFPDTSQIRIEYLTELIKNIE